MSAGVKGAGKDGLSIVGQLGGDATALTWGPEGRMLYVGIGPRLWRVAAGSEGLALRDASPVLGGVVRQVARVGSTLLVAAEAGGLSAFDLDRPGAAWSTPVWSSAPRGRLVFELSVDPSSGRALVIEASTAAPFFGDRALVYRLREEGAPVLESTLRVPDLEQGRLRGRDLWLLDTFGKLLVFRMAAEGAEPEPLLVDPSIGRSSGLLLVDGEPWLVNRRQLLRVAVSASAPEREAQVRGVEALDLPFEAVRSFDGEDHAAFVDKDGALWRWPLRTRDEPWRERIAGPTEGLAATAKQMAVLGASRLHVYPLKPGLRIHPESGAALELAAISDARGVALDGGCALVLERHTWISRLRWVALPSPARPRYFGDLAYDRGGNVAAQEGVFYVVNRETATQLRGFGSARCGDAQPEHRVRLPRTGGDLALDGDRGLIANGYFMSSIDLADRRHPRLLASWPNRSLEAAVDAVALEEGRWAMLLPGSLRIGLLNAVGWPTQSASRAIPSGATDLLLDDGQLVVALARSLALLDLSDPRRIVVLDELDLPGRSRALVGGPEGRVWALVNDPPAGESLRLLRRREGRLVEGAWVALPGTGWGLAAEDGLALVAAGEAGLIVVRDPSSQDAGAVYLPWLRGEIAP